MRPATASRPALRVSDQAALSALREFFLILDAWDRAELTKVSTDVRSPVDNLPHQAQGEPNCERQDEANGGRGYGA